MLREEFGDESRLVVVKGSPGGELERALEQQDWSDAALGFVQGSTPTFGEESRYFCRPVTLCPCVDPGGEGLGSLRDGDELFEVCVACAAGTRLGTSSQQA